MAEIVLFHHALGQTDGFGEFAESVRRDGHTVHTPDLFDGRTFDTLEQGVAFADEVGFPTLAERGSSAVAELPGAVVYAGFSLGVLPAQRLAQTRPGARGALLFHSCVPASTFGSGWPDGVPVQVHAAEADPFFVDDGDIDAARALVEEADDAELFLYPGSGHLFAEAAWREYDAASARLLLERTLDFLERHG